ncbi:MAG TPA: hypothetical protein EYP14_12880 [Planctomycetaceae bacterium]|nr:hypothetical protein [Planctomycetaceae bacterium]
MGPFKQRLAHWLFPDPVRELPYARAWNIASRTAHLAATGLLLGGHAYNVAADRLLLPLYLSILTGAALIFIEAYPSLRWLYQGRGVMVLAKLALLLIIPWLWPHRLIVLLAVLLIASVGSHMPSRFRYYSLVHGRVLNGNKK